MDEKIQDKENQIDDLKKQNQEIIEEDKRILLEEKRKQEIEFLLEVRNCKKKYTDENRKIL